MEPPGRDARHRGGTGKRSRPLEDHELIERSRRGDDDAFERLVERHYDLALRVAYVVSGDAAEAEDAVQEATIRAARSLAGLRDAASFRSWFVQIAANEARDRRRRVRRQEALTLRLRHEHPTGGSVPSSEHSLLRRESKRALLDAVNGLSELDRQVIACRFFLGLSEAETAAALACRPGTVKSRQSRALRRLAATLDREDWIPILSPSEEAL